MNRFRKGPPQPPLHLLVCSASGCADDMSAMITSELDDEPVRLCEKHRVAAIEGVAITAHAERAARETRRHPTFFDELSPIEQWQLEGR